VRIGTRTPVVLPYRITDDLVDMLKRHHPIWLNTHFNHPRELTPSAREALRKLADAESHLATNPCCSQASTTAPR
jgi:lysine 2,3-aminomutase